ncbi:MAG: electron transport complex subunit RsxB [Gammaproteobacteria bacterium]|nr:electron transport complex subunit RsxB [Gammaproteobacteria bacterium]
MTWAAALLVWGYVSVLATICLVVRRQLRSSPRRAAADRHREHLLVDRINAMLPQTQCGQCGYPGCRPYAEAIQSGVAINRCPPGGAATITRLAGLLDRPELPLDPRHGVESVRKVAFIREAECIGCTKCIQACPVDAIAGAPKRMHTVIARDCTGCDLCVSPCPVDCIDMLPVRPAAGTAGTGTPTGRSS